MISDNINVYMSLRNGRIVTCPVRDISSGFQREIRSVDKRSPLDFLKLSRDDSFLIGYANIDKNEKFFVYNLTRKEEPWEASLDLSAGAQREDPEKLIIISEDCLNIFIRGENSKGVVMYSLFDGSIV